MTPLVSHPSLYLCRGGPGGDVGVSDDEVGWAEVLAAFAFACLATAIPLTPGGGGAFVEAVLITTLSAAEGDRDQMAGGAGLAGP